MERYSEYKPSSIQWLKELPGHWEEKRLVVICEPKNITNCSDEQLLSVFLGKGVVLFNSENTRRTNAITQNTDLTKYQLVEPGDFVLNNQQAWRGSVGVSFLRGIVSPAYIVLRFKKSNNAKFLDYALQSRYMIGQFFIYSKGVGSIQKNISWKELKSSLFLCPPLAEQEQIVNFLESKTSKIDEVLSAKEAQIKLLQELKESEIANVITHGLNPNVKMKSYDSLLTDSYPVHWEIKRNKSFLSLTGEKVGKRANDFALLSLTTKGVIVRDVESGKGKFPKDFDEYQVVKKDNLIFCLFDIDETPRTVGLVEIEGMITGAYTALKVNEEYALPKYIYYYYLCVDNIKGLKPYYSGLRKTVRSDKFLQLYLPLPSLEEQMQIVDYIENKCNNIDVLIGELQAEIEYLKEYKQSLIADCVTGQIKV